MGLFNESFLLRAYDSNSMGEGPNDQLAIVRNIDLTSGNGSVNLASMLQPGATVDYAVFKRASLSSGVLTIDATPPTDEATTDATIMILVNSNKIKNMGE